MTRQRVSLYDSTSSTSVTQEQHQQIGADLYRIRHELPRVSVQVANAYPRGGTESGPGRSLQTAVDRIDRARTDLENAMFREHPPTGDIRTYYPGPGE